MTTGATMLTVDDLRGAFRQWRADQEPLEAQLSESLDALLAYQSQLDGWQQQLAREREELTAAREEFARNKAAAAESQASCVAELKAELSAAREKNSTLTSALLARTEELRALDNRRAELFTELELTRAREKELRATWEESKQMLEQEQTQWAEELRQLREILAHSAQVANGGSFSTDECEGVNPNAELAEQVAAAHSHCSDETAEPPVFGSVLQQFGKLRQQRALDRPALKKAR